MVDTSYQRMGLGMLLTEHMSEIADEGGAATYVRARLKMTVLFVQMGYEVLERIGIELMDLGVDLAGADTKRSIIAMQREVGAESESGGADNWVGVVGIGRVYYSMGERW